MNIKFIIYLSLSFRDNKLILTVNKKPIHKETAQSYKIKGSIGEYEFDRYTQKFPSGTYIKKSAIGKVLPRQSKHIGFCVLVDVQKDPSIYIQKLKDGIMQSNIDGKGVLFSSEKRITVIRFDRRYPEEIEYEIGADSCIL